MSRLATLAGVPLEAPASVSWRFTQGVQPHQRTFEVHKNRAAAILEKAPPGKPVELYMDGANPLLVSELYVLTLSPSDHPDRLRVLVTDSRYWADRILVVGRYNMRRRAFGEFRLVDGQLERIAPQPDVTFAKYSLLGELVPYTAEYVIRDVLEQMAKGKWSPGKVDFSKLKQLDVDGFELQDDGQSALKRALDLVPGLKVYMSKGGLWTLTVDGEEGEALAGAPPPFVGPDLSFEVDVSRIRPSKIEVYFQAEDEVRFDFLEGITSTTTAKEPRIFRNVLPLPDKKLTISGKVVVAGTWVEINQALLDAWNADADNPPVVQVAGKPAKTLRAISFEIIQKLWFRQSGYHAYKEIQTQNPVWGRRWNAIMKHYRQTFQVDRRWRDRLRSARAERVAIVDPENARHAASDIYVDHCELPSVKRIGVTRNDPSKKLVLNKKAWDSLSDANRYLKDGHIAETAIWIPQDDDQLVWRLVLKVDQEGNSVNMQPSLVASKADGATVDMPEADLRRTDGLFMLGLAQLSTKHRLSTVLTVASASPRGRDGLYKVDVTPDEAKSVLPESVKAKIGACKGPVFQIFVAPGVCVAPFAWRDEDAVYVENTILNGAPRKTKCLYPEHVKNVAKSMAAVLYALFSDRWQGQHVGDLDPEAAPVGRISSVIHTLGRRGVLTTTRDMPPSVKSLNFRALLPEDTRRFFFAKVQP